MLPATATIVTTTTTTKVTVAAIITEASAFIPDHKNPTIRLFSQKHKKINNALKVMVEACLSSNLCSVHSQNTITAAARFTGNSTFIPTYKNKTIFAEKKYRLAIVKKKSLFS